jgi:predicted lactoylglutathione lyase
MEEGIDDEDNERIDRVRHRVQEEIGCVLWRENINQDIVYELHLLDVDQQCLWKKGCRHWW